MTLYIGLMSGTSVDGIDTALVDFANDQPKLIATHYTPYHNELRAKILALCQRGEDEIQRLGELDIKLGKAFAQAVNELLVQQKLSAKDICAIGSHGQTIRHYPHHHYPFTLQIADPNTIAALTGITTVADFRRKDVACGGQGAPLVPAFHQAVFGGSLKALDPVPEATRDDSYKAQDMAGRAIVNIGGIANATLLKALDTAPLDTGIASSQKTPLAMTAQDDGYTGQDNSCMGFDTGPGNTLMDAWIGQHKNLRQDERGEWAKQGKVNQPLLQHMLTDSYFTAPAPKSTGREYFNLSWLQKQLSHFALSPEDVQATLVELTAQSICDAVRAYLSQGEMLVCGGGVQNDYLMSRLQELAQPLSVHSTQQFGMDPAWIEAVAFAWLARETLNKRPGNLPTVTGATRETILGGVYFA